MEADFWHQRWSDKRIGFHQDKATPLLVSHWDRLALDRKTPVFVPLCGKSQDMIWLNQQGHPVQGVELSRTAIEEFDIENALQGQWKTIDGFELYCAGSIQIWHADLFALSSKQLGTIQAIFDRAALIALPKDMRTQYSDHISSLAAPHCQQLLICLEYEQSKREGPPFSVSENDVKTLYSDWQHTSLARKSIAGKQPASQDSAHHLLLVQQSI